MFYYVSTHVNAVVVLSPFFSNVNAHSICDFVTPFSPSTSLKRKVMLIKINFQNVWHYHTSLFIRVCEPIKKSWCRAYNKLLSISQMEHQSFATRMAASGLLYEKLCSSLIQHIALLAGYKAEQRKFPI